MLFKKNEEEKPLFEELSKTDLTRLTLDYNRTVIGQLYCRMLNVTLIIVVFTLVAEFTSGLTVGGVINVVSLLSTSIIGFGIYFILRFLYYNALERYYYKKIKFNKTK